MIASFLLVTLLSGCCEAGDFVATNEWQEIKEGQSIGKGLHVRLNLQTGIKEAKLMDENESGRFLFCLLTRFFEPRV